MSPCAKAALVATKGSGRIAPHALNNLEPGGAVDAKDVLAREALVRLPVMFQLDAGWAALPPVERHRRRQRVTGIGPWLGSAEESP